MFIIGGCAKKEKVQEPVSTSTPLLLEVTKKGTDNKLYLFGSIHAAEESIYPLPDYVLKAYNESKIIAFEFDIIEYEKDISSQMDLLSKFIIPEEKKITDYIEKDIYDKSVEILKNAGLYSPLFDHYSPIIWQTLLENTVITDTNLDGNLGIDNYFLKQSKEDNKEILELESAQFQYNILLGFDYDTQVYLLNQAVTEYDNSKNEMKKLYELYQKGNKEELEQLLFQSEEADPYMEEYNEKLITKRNINMAVSLEQALEEGKNIFCTVGLAHIIGEGGIADLLEQKGYSVTIIK